LALEVGNGLATITKIREKEVTERAQDPSNFGEETRHIRVTMGCFDVDYGIKTSVGKVECHGIATGEPETSALMSSLTEFNCPSISINTMHGIWV
jgi:hypothetical protein